MPTCPQISLEATEMVMGISCAYYLNELDLPVNAEQIANVTPCTTGLRQYAAEGASNTLFLARETSSSNSHIFLQAPIKAQLGYLY